MNSKSKTDAALKKVESALRDLRVAVHEERDERKAAEAKPERPKFSNLELCQQALAAKGPMSATDIFLWVKDNVWPDCQSSLVASVYGYVSQHKLIKRADGKLMLPAKEGERNEPPPVKKQPTRAEPQKPKQFLSTERRPFEHGGKQAMLNQRWWKIVSRLYPSMGRGFLPISSVVDSAFGSERMPPNPAGWLQSERFGLNEELAHVGLCLVIEPAGCYLRQLEQQSEAS